VCRQPPRIALGSETFALASISESNRNEIDSPTRFVSRDAHRSPVVIRGRVLLENSRTIRRAEAVASDSDAFGILRKLSNSFNDSKFSGWIGSFPQKGAHNFGQVDGGLESSSKTISASSFRRRASAWAPKRLQVFIAFESQTNAGRNPSDEYRATGNDVVACESRRCTRSGKSRSRPRSAPFGSLRISIPISFHPFKKGENERLHRHAANICSLIPRLWNCRVPATERQNIDARADPGRESMSTEIPDIPA